MERVIAILSALFLAVLLTTCATVLAAGPPTMRGATTSFLRSLSNATYPLEAVKNGTVTLQNGTYSASAAPGSASKTVVRLGKLMAIGDLNGDGIEDAGVLLLVDGSGSGSFTYLAPVINDAGRPAPLRAIFLGDRIVVESLAIREGRVIVTLLARGPAEPMAAPPHIECTLVFAVEGERTLPTQ